MNLKQRWNLIYCNAAAKLESEVSNTYAGILWWVLEPMMLLAIYYLLFKVLLNRGGEDYIQFLFLGLLTWRWWANSVQKLCSSILSQKGLIKSVYIHKWVLPLIDLSFITWKFLIVFMLSVLVYALTMYGLSLHYLALPLVLLVQLIIIVGAGFFLCSITPFFPDIRLLLPHFMRLLFYPSGILFDLNSVPEKYQVFIKWNFIAGLVQSYRNIIMYQSWPDWFALALGAVIGIILLLTGGFIMNKYDRTYPKMM